jgi:hypothetical protein
MCGAFISSGGLTLDANYTFYTYPDFTNAHEMGAKLSYEVFSDGPDPDAARNTSLRTSAGVYYGSLDQIGLGRGYLELGLEPVWRFSAGETRIAVSFPVQWGMNLDGYYFDAGHGEEFLGFLSAGIAVSVALPAPPDCGSWFVTGSLRHLHLAADNLEALNGGDQYVLVGKVGVGFVY